MKLAWLEGVGVVAENGERVEGFFVSKHEVSDSHVVVRGCFILDDVLTAKDLDQAADAIGDLL